MFLHQLPILNDHIIHADEHLHGRRVEEIRLVGLDLLNILRIRRHRCQRLQLADPELGRAVKLQDLELPLRQVAVVGRRMKLCEAPWLAFV